MSNEFYANHYARYAEVLEETGPAWLAAMRREAAARFAELGGVPTTRNEEYKYTSLRALSRMALVPALRNTTARDSRADTAQIAAGLERLGLERPTATRLVFVDGHFSAELSRVASLPEGVRVSTLGEELQRDPEFCKGYLSRLKVAHETYPFAAVNAAFMQDGAFVHVPRGRRVVEPIELLHVASARAEGTASHARSLVCVDESAQVTLIETFVSLTDAPYLTNHVLELHLDENAFADHYRVQKESEQAHHLSLLRVRQERSSNFATHNFSFGGGLVRNDLHGVLDGDGIECILNGLYMGRGTQHIDNHTAIDHAQPHGHSYELYKGVLDDKATAVFNGKIFVRKPAQKTDAIQSNKNLLLSSDAQVNTKPQLEIWADDVRCTHGATIGQLDREALFYLRTRGLSRETAKSVLTYAFANEVIDNVRVPALQEALEHELAQWLPHTAELEAAR